MEKCVSENLKHRKTLYMAIKKSLHNCTKFLIKQLSKCSLQKQSAEDVLENRCFFKISQNLQNIICVRNSGCATLLKKRIGNFFIRKETPAEVLSCEFWEIFQNTFFIEHLRATTSINNLMDCSRAIVTARADVDYLFPTSRHIHATHMTFATKYEVWNIVTFKCYWKKERKSNLL